MKKARTKDDLPKVENPLLDTDHGAAMLGVSRRTFQGLIHRNEIAYIKIGRSIRLDRDDIQLYIIANKSQIASNGGQKS